MAFGKARLHQAIGTETGGNLVDESGKRLAFLGHAGKILLRRIKPLAPQNRQPEDFEAISGIEIVMDRLQPLAKERRDAVCIVQRHGRMRPDTEHPPVDAKQQELE